MDFKNMRFWKMLACVGPENGSPVRVQLTTTAMKKLY